MAHFNLTAHAMCRDFLTMKKIPYGFCDRSSTKEFLNVKVNKFFLSTAS